MAKRYLSNTGAFGGSDDQPMVAHEFDTSQELSGASARLAAFKNAGAEVASISKDGDIVCGLVNGVDIESIATAAGNVYGPTINTVTNNDIVTWNGTTGQHIKDSGVTVSSLATASSVSNLSNTVNTKVSLTGDTMTGNLNLDNNKALLFSELDSNGSNTITVKGPASLVADYSLTLPGDDGTANQVLTTDGSGVLSWSDPASVSVPSVNPQNTSYSLVITDANDFINMTNGSAANLTVPKDSTVNFPIGTTVAYWQGGAGAVTLLPEDGTITIRSLNGLVSSGQYGVASIFKIAANLWVAAGALTA